MAEPVALASIYTEVCIVPPTFLHGYRTQQELQELFLQRGPSWLAMTSTRHNPIPGLSVANDEKPRFLNLLGAPGAGKSTFLRYLGWMALQRNRPGTTANGVSSPCGIALSVQPVAGPAGAPELAQCLPQIWWR